MTEKAASQSLVSALASLIKLIKAVSLYPVGHPALEKQLQLCTATFGLLVAGDGCELLIKKRGIFFSSEQIVPEDINIRKLAEGLFARRISKITLLDDLDAADLFVW